MQSSRLLTVGTRLAALGAFCVLSMYAGAVFAPQAPTDPAAFLKWSMSSYQALGSFQAESAWQQSFGSAGAAVESKRVLVYVKPNRFKVISTHAGSFTQISVCDGKKIVEYSTSAELGAQTYPAPASIAEVSSMQMQHPMFCGSLLYRFFGGPARLSALADTHKAPILFGPDVTLDGQRCKTVRFYATGLYGKTEVAIGVKDGLVHRIRYGNEPLLEMMKGSKDVPQNVMKGLPAKLETVELFSRLVVAKPIAAATFDTTVPKNLKTTEMPSSSEESSPPVPVGQAAPEFEVASLTGETKRLSDLRGKVVLLDFWATWCPPCRKGLPETQQLHREFADKGLAVLAISDEDSKTVEPFLKQNSYSFPTYLDAKGAAGKIYKVEAIPTVVIITREGRLSAYMVGLQSPETIRAELKKAGLETK